METAADSYPALLSEGSLQSHVEDWRPRACELLERGVEHLSLINSQLASESAALAACIIDRMNDLGPLSDDHSEVDKWSTFSEFIRNQLMELSKIELHSLDAEELVDDAENLTYRDVGKSDSYPGPSSKFNNPRNSERNQLMKRVTLRRVGRNPHNFRRRLVGRKPAILSRQIAPSQPTYDDMDEAQPLSTSPCKNEASSTGPREPTKPASIRMETSDESSSRTAFYLFAKHIGPMLKRQYRSTYDGAPTQRWLADQLLLRWKDLPVGERSNWFQRAASS